MTMHLWGESTASPMNAVHFGFGLGAIIAPFLAWPFMSHDTSSSQLEASIGNLTYIHSQSETNMTFLPYSKLTENLTIAANENTTISMDSESQLIYPYSIIAVIGILFTAVMMCFYCCGAPEGFPIRTPKKSTAKNLLSPGSCVPGGRTIYGIALFSVLFVYFIQVVSIVYKTYL